MTEYGIALDIGTSGLRCQAIDLETGETVATVNTRAYLTMGLGYKGLGRPFKARNCFRKAVSLKPDNLWADVMLR